VERFRAASDRERRSNVLPSGVARDCPAGRHWASCLFPVKGRAPLRRPTATGAGDGSPADDHRAGEDTAYRALAQDEVSAMAEAGRTFGGIRFAETLALDDLDFTESRFERCLFSVPMIRGADFSAAKFKDCKFEPTRFASCKLADARLEGCSLFDVQRKKGCTFAFCDLQAVEIVKSNLATTCFERCDLYNVRAAECSFRGARFDRSTFTRALSRRAAMTKASFDKCNLSFADLSGLHLQGCEFLSCRFSEASFIDSDLSDATMLACTLDRAEWDRARLRNADLRGSRLSGLNLAVLSDHAGLTISESEQSEILRQLGVDVRPE
jgi:fluoroquinolone resistance protein